MFLTLKLGPLWKISLERVKVRNIGVCNFGTAMLRGVLNYSKIKPGVLQVEMHPYNTQEKLLRFCRLNGVAFTAFSNLGPSSFVELGMANTEES